jgi:hypothetical protein
MKQHLPIEAIGELQPTLVSANGSIEQLHVHDLVKGKVPLGYDVIMSAGLEGHDLAIIANYTRQDHGDNALVGAEVENASAWLEARRSELSQFGQRWPVVVIPTFG